MRYSCENRCLRGREGTEPAVWDHQDNRGVSDIHPLARYIHSHPKDRISVVINNTDELLHKLVSGEIQFALVEGYYDDVDFDSMVFRTEPFIPVCAAGHVLPGSRSS